MIELNKEKFKIIGCDNANADIIVRPNITYFQDAWRRLKQNKVAMVSLVLLVIISLLCVFGPYIGHYKYDFQILDLANKKPFGDHWFGLDHLGRDIFARIWIGGRVSIAIGVIGTIIEQRHRPVLTNFYAIV